MATESEQRLANALWTLLWETATSKPPKATLNMLNSDWKAKLKFEMKACKVTKFKLKWFLQFPHHFRLEKEIIVAVSQGEQEESATKKEEAVAKSLSPRPETVVLKSVLRSEEIKASMGKTVTFGRTETIFIKSIKNSAFHWTMPGKKSRVGASTSEPLECYLRLEDLPPDDDSPEEDTSVGSGGNDGDLEENSDDGFEWSRDDDDLDGFEWSRDDDDELGNEGNERNAATNEGNERNMAPTDVCNSPKEEKKSKKGTKYSHMSSAAEPTSLGHKQQKPTTGRAVSSEAHVPSIMRGDLVTNNNLPNNDEGQNVCNTRVVGALPHSCDKAKIEHNDATTSGENDVIPINRPRTSAGTFTHINPETHKFWLSLYVQYPAQFRQAICIDY